MPETEKKLTPKPEEKPCCHDKDECRNAGYEYAEVGIPVELKPKTEVKKAETECVGAPVVTCERGAAGESCHIVITQKVRVKIPYRVGVMAKPGNDYIKCCCKEKTKDPKDPKDPKKPKEPKKPKKPCPCHKDD